MVFWYGTIRHIWGSVGTTQTCVPCLDGLATYFEPSLDRRGTKMTVSISKTLHRNFFSIYYIISRLIVKQITKINGTFMKIVRTKLLFTCHEQTKKTIKDIWENGFL
jgi:hypothetical protein